ncbi:NADPH:quinone reductase [Sphaerisporangium rufum]|uniref:NADPH:quinone reductase n=1 Tax=Sphaerisporangium rufum TaxID=1381558 RepID=A0A919R4S3_9ACTN|nr:NAD(P)-dependent alcohol dehydrogenase [Sphaerisporangium rufum]GII79534.1 NADPH:quinone reductase [Sphaerisporangium rufum]
MKAIVQDRYGAAEVLRLRDIDRPVPGDGEVLVQVRAAGVDPGVWVFMTGRPYIVRAGLGLRRPRVRVRGRDVAGVVTAVGAGVTRFRPGDEVYGTTTRGAYAEYAVARADRLAPKPAGLTFEQAAAAPVSGQTAVQALRDVARVREGQRVLVIGAAGGVGSFAVQIARAYGATVTAVCGPDKADLVRSLGAARVVDYTRQEVDGEGPVYDVVVDTAGCRPLSTLRRAMAPGGTLVLVGGGHATGPLLGGMERGLRALLLSPFTRHRLRMLMALERSEVLAELTRLIESGHVTPAVGRVHPLAEAPAALHHLAEGHPAGKIVITV